MGWDIPLWKGSITIIDLCFVHANLSECHVTLESPSESLPNPWKLMASHGIPKFHAEKTGEIRLIPQ